MAQGQNHFDPEVPALSRRPVTIRRLIPWTVFALLATALVLLPGRTPAAVGVVLAMLTAVAALFLATDMAVDRWMRGYIGRESTPRQFLAEEGPRLLAAAGVVVAALGSYLLWRLAPGGLLRTGLFSTIAAGFLAVVAGGTWRMARASARRAADPNRAVLDRVAPPPLRVQLRDAMEFQRICGPRLALPLLRIWVASLAILALGASVFGVLVLSGASDESFRLLEPNRWPLALRVGLLGCTATLSWTLATAVLASFRLTFRMRRVGRLRAGEGWKELGLSVERTGFVGTVAWGAMMLFLAGLLAAGAAGLAWGLAAAGGIPGVLAGLLSAALALVVGWAMLIWPQLYLFAIMTRRDCGWMHGFEASAELAVLEKSDSLLRAAVATAMALTVVLIPAAIALLLAGAEARELVVASLLGEKTRKDVEDQLREEERSAPTALSKFHELLEKGRYLDALNGFQMQLLRNPESVPHLRGASLALLRMGNPKARELLERWETLAPDDPEPRRLLEEMAQGRWRDSGDLFQEADRRCTQRIGRGV